MNLTIALKYARRIAKTNEYQTLCNGAKEYGFALFENARDFSAIQLYFLSYLNFYATISMDIYLDEIDEKVFEHEIYEDAYMFYKLKERKRKKEQQNTPAHTGSDKSIQKVSQIQSKWQFRRPK